MIAFALGLPIQAAAGDTSAELINPLVCSAATASQPLLRGICEITPLGANRYKNKVNLTAKMAPIEVGGYTVETENYNGTYLSPVVQAMPGDTVAAHLENLLEPRNTNDHQEMSHGPTGDNPTNLHFFHGGIVTPNNARPPVDAGRGNGDNIYVRLKNGKDEAGKAYSFDYNVPIPGEGELDAGVLEGKEGGVHPSGLNWYHSHLHGISSDQVMGGLSGLLSIGEDKANVRAKCAPDPRCDKGTAELKDKTDARYVLLRDLPIKMINALPEDAKGANATWDPEARDFRSDDKHKCEVWKKGDSESTPDAKLSEGFLSAH